jgi:hypothetical protein
MKFRRAEAVSEIARRVLSGTETAAPEGTAGPGRSVEPRPTDLCADDGATPRRGDPRPHCAFPGCRRPAKWTDEVLVRLRRNGLAAATREQTHVTGCLNRCWRQWRHSTSTSTDPTDHSSTTSHEDRHDAASSGQQALNSDGARPTRRR